ncbi:MAG: hypothetical protein JXB05_16970 [Myxococcaceae bacterium]|nr:hypothetical protein [Myxococcaceae bacterium]
MRSSPVLLSLLLLALAPRALAAPPAVGYAQAEDYLEKDTRPGRYNPLNVLDGRDSTVWCAPEGDGARARMTIGFKGVARVDEVRIYTGNGSARETFKAYGRAKRIILEGKDSARSFTLEDKRGLQLVPLSPPVSGGWLTLEVVDTFPGSEPQAPVCITDVIFYSGGKPLNGTKMAPRLKYDARTAPLLGTWFAGHEGAPDRFLSFYVDGTYRFVLEPLGEGEPRVLTGGFTASGSRLALELPRKGRASVRFRREQAEGAAGGHTLILEGDLPDDWKAPFRSRP